MLRRLLLSTLALLASLGPVRALRAEGAWQPSGDLLVPRTLHTVTALDGGAGALVVGGYDDGGYLASVERYDAASAMSEARAPLATARHSHTADLLEDGTVLVAGGYGTSNYLASAERWNPADDTWHAVSPLTEARIGHASVRLEDGRVLVVGGYNNGGLVATAELFDPATETWSPALGVMSAPRARLTATLLADGRVLLAGGFADEVALTLVERFDPATGLFEALGPLADARWFHGATRLPDGRVWMVGGQDAASALASTELYDPVAGVSSAGPTLAGGRAQPSVTAFEDLASCGRGPLVMAGYDGATDRATSVELDLASLALVDELAMPTGRREQAHARLDDCSIAVFGGQSSDGYATSIDRLADVGGAGGAGGGGGDDGPGASSGDGCACTTPARKGERRGVGLACAFVLAWAARRPRRATLSRTGR